MGDDMRNLIVYVIGPPGVGKRTVGTLLAEELPGKLVDNHFWLNPVLGLVEQDGVTPLPGRFWDFATRSRRTVMDTIAELSPTSWNFIFTHAAVGAGNDLDNEIAQDIKNVAKARNADLRAVCLTASADELERRVVLPGRRELMKELDPIAARRNAEQPPFDPGVINTIHIDSTLKSPCETVRQVLSELRIGTRRTPLRRQWTGQRDPRGHG